MLTTKDIWAQIKAIGPSTPDAGPLAWSVQSFDLSFLLNVDADFLTKASDGVLELARLEGWTASVDQSRWHLSPPSGHDQKPVHRGIPSILRVECSGFGPLTAVTLEPPAPAPGRGQWILLLGDNSTGKTTFLRACVLALLDFVIAERGITTAYDGNSVVKFGADYAYAKVEIPGATFQKVFGDAPRAQIGPPPLFPIREVPIFAYGAQRVLVRSRDPNIELPDSYGWDAVASLFLDTSRLIDPEAWLLCASQTPALTNYVDRVLLLLADLLPEVHEARVFEKRVEFVLPGDQVVGFRLLSDGFLVVVGWIVDFLARWARYATGVGMALEDPLERSIEALVIVDELDLHLHPRWQQQIVGQLKRILPRVSFLATTHSPLIAQGADAGEVFIFEREDGTDLISLAPANIPRGADIDSVLTGVWFGLGTTVDEDTQRLLAEYLELLAAADGSLERRRELEGVLRSRFLSIGNTSIDRIAWSVASSLIDEGFSQLSAQDRESIRDAIAAETRRRLEGE